MTKPKILLQLDSDSQASVFDAVVALDAGVDQLLQYCRITPADARGLVHGAIFTRGPKDLAQTAIFVGGSHVGRGEQILAEITKTFFGPFRVSVLLDANGANTTAAAAVLAAAQHLDLAGTTAIVLGGTGPVGQRVARLLLACGARVFLASRSAETAAGVAQQLAARQPGAQVSGVATSVSETYSTALATCELVIACGAAGVQLLDEATRATLDKLRVAIDLNAVPPAGIAGIEVADAATRREGVICYGAIGVGGTKMKIHKAAVARLFTANNLVLDAEEIFALGRALVGAAP